MSTSAFASDPTATHEPIFAVERWSATSGSARSSRADLVLTGAGRRWRAHTNGNGAVDALLKAVDIALGAVLGEGVELQTYNVHATGHGHDTSAAVTVSLRPRSGDPHAPAYPGHAVHENILEASLTAYVDAINRLVTHGNVDVAAAAPAPDATEVPARAGDADTSERHKERFMEMFNH
jgi:hypothetical protein